MADVGIAVGSGSDVAIPSAEFVLMSSRLTSVLVLIDLSRTVFGGSGSTLDSDLQPRRLTGCRRRVVPGDE